MVFYLPAWQLSSIPQSLLVHAIDKSGDAESDVWERVDNGNCGEARKVAKKVKSLQRRLVDRGNSGGHFPSLQPQWLLYGGFIHDTIIEPNGAIPT